MQAQRLTRHSAALGVAASLLFGCGGSQPPIGAPGTVAPSAIAQHAARVKSWMLPEAKSDDLLYVASPGENSSGQFVVAFSYPSGKPMGQLSVYASQLCSDRDGNIFVTQGSKSGNDSKIVEYAHGGTEPITTLSDPYNGAFGCAVDPATGNLAVANSGGFNGMGTVLVYPEASGTPTVYQPTFQAFYCGYDNKGNLFVMGYHGRTRNPLAELAYGSSQFSHVKLNKYVEFPMGIQWDGSYLVLGEGTNDYNNGRLRRYEVKATHGVLKGGIRLGVTASNFFIQGSTVIVPNGVNYVWLLSYPGAVRKKSIPLNSPYGVTVSVAPSR